MDTDEEDEGVEALGDRAVEGVVPLERGRLDEVENDLLHQEPNDEQGERRKAETKRILRPCVQPVGLVDEVVNDGQNASFLSFAGLHPFITGSPIFANSEASVCLRYSAKKLGEVERKRFGNIPSKGGSAGFEP